MQEIPNLDTFAEMSEQSLFGIYESNFSWLSLEQMGLLEKAIQFGQTCRPAINNYYWTSIPRIIVAMTMYADYFGTFVKNARLSVLDLGACQPVAAFWRLGMPEMSRRSDFVYVTEQVERFREESDLGVFSDETMGFGLDNGILPFEDDRFDAVIFTEVLEHLNIHPQKILCEIARVLKPGGCVILSTPNVSSWKKIYALSNGNWGYDSPTFSDGWGHRYEYSYYQVRTMLLRSGFSIAQEQAVDVYFDDPKGFRSTVQLTISVLSKILTGDMRNAAKFWRRRGSGLFFCACKKHVVKFPAPDEFINV